MCFYFIWVSHLFLLTPLTGFTTGLKIILKCIDLQWLRGGGAVVSAATSRPEGSGFEPEGQCGINICYVGPIIHLTFNAHEICPALLNHCKIHSHQLDLERRKPRNRNQTFSLTLLYVVRVPIYLNTPNSIWYITLCHNAPQHLCGPSAAKTHLFFSQLRVDAMQLDFLFLL